MASLQAEMLKVVDLNIVSGTWSDEVKVVLLFSKRMPHSPSKILPYPERIQRLLGEVRKKNSGDFTVRLTEHIFYTYKILILWLLDQLSENLKHSNTAACTKKGWPVVRGGQCLNRKQISKEKDWTDTREVPDLTGALDLEEWGRGDERRRGGLTRNKS